MKHVRTSTLTKFVPDVTYSKANKSPHISVSKREDKEKKIRRRIKLEDYVNIDLYRRAGAK